MNVRDAEGDRKAAGRENGCAVVGGVITFLHVWARGTGRGRP